MEEVPAEQDGQIAWFVDVFAADDAGFRQATQSAGATLVPSVYTGEADPDYD